MKKSTRSRSKKDRLRNTARDHSLFFLLRTLGDDVNGLIWFLQIREEKLINPSSIVLLYIKILFENHIFPLYRNTVTVEVQEHLKP